ncbi:RluA family pseudouridine synthase [Candidatus Annandia adelgestsuga]|uniref:RluA family pseudouridine synthase n=1 Tax=Candidatus Annandia adelgestsuga TaxID=1302411 RepID=UPI001E553C15|nr:pseudouridine synthase [Candidatus Annandia adelgestsuga]
MDKQKNLVVHPGFGNLSKTMFNAILYHFPDNASLEKAGLIHRLDKDTTGLIIIARNMLSMFFLKKEIKFKKIIKKYEAIVIGNIKKNNIINKPILRDKIIKNKMSINKNGKIAITKYKILEKFNNYTHIIINLKTGRTHQIRIHMASCNYPLLGDKLYNKKKKKYYKNMKKIYKKKIKKIINFPRPALHSTIIKFKHPNKKKNIKITSKLPKDMSIIINLLKKM